MIFQTKGSLMTVEVNQEVTRKRAGIGGSVRAAISKWCVRAFEPLYIPFGEQVHSCIKEYLVRVATEVSPLRIVSQLEIKNNAAIYFPPFFSIFPNCFLSSVITIDETPLSSLTSPLYF